jgi:hypothetical protein
MAFFYHNGKSIPGDKIKLSVLRTDLVPIPETLEISLRLDDENRAQLIEGNDITVSGGRAFRIVKVDVERRNAEQGPRLLESVHITAVMRPLHQLTFVRPKAIWLEKTTFTDIYRAAGAELSSAIKGDVAVPRYACMIGDTPTFGIAKLFQECGGVMRVNSEGAMEFMKLPTLFTQTPKLNVPANVTEDINSGFLERHEIPWFVSTKPESDIQQGNNTKPRHARYQPLSDEGVLRNMTQVLIQAKKARVDLNVGLCAGDTARLSDGTLMTILTAAHVHSVGTHGSDINQYTRVWLGVLNEAKG